MDNFPSNQTEHISIKNTAAESEKWDFLFLLLFFTHNLQLSPATEHLLIKNPTRESEKEDIFFTRDLQLSQQPNRASSNSKPNGGKWKRRHFFPPTIYNFPSNRTEHPLIKNPTREFEKGDIFFIVFSPTVLKRSNEREERESGRAGEGETERAKETLTLERRAGESRNEEVGMGRSEATEIGSFWFDISLHLIRCYNGWSRRRRGGGRAQSHSLKDIGAELERWGMAVLRSGRWWVGVGWWWSTAPSIAEEEEDECSKTEEGAPLVSFWSWV